MQESPINRRLKKLLSQHAGRAWDAEMQAALGGLADKFDQWREGAMTCENLHRAVHEYHDGIAREIWKRYRTNKPEIPLAYAVATGFVSRESLPEEFVDHIELHVRALEEVLEEG